MFVFGDTHKTASTILSLFLTLMARTIRNINFENKDDNEIKYLNQQKNKSDRKSSRKELREICLQFS